MKIYEELDSVIFNAIPASLFILNHDLNIVRMNTAAYESVKFHNDSLGDARWGDIHGCINALNNPGGCGSSKQCDACVIRQSVLKAREGNDITRARTKTITIINDEKVETYYSVTAALLKFEKSVNILLILEDITELITFKGMLPICAGCKNIRDDKGYWEKIESYLSEKTDVEFTHSLCPDCISRLYPNLPDE